MQQESSLLIAPLCRPHPGPAPTQFSWGLLGTSPASTPDLFLPTLNFLAHRCPFTTSHGVQLLQLTRQASLLRTLSPETGLRSPGASAQAAPGTNGWTGGPSRGRAPRRARACLRELGGRLGARCTPEEGVGRARARGARHPPGPVCGHRLRPRPVRRARPRAAGGRAERGRRVGSTGSVQPHSRPCAEGTEPLAARFRRVTAVPRSSGSPEP